MAGLDVTEATTPVEKSLRLSDQNLCPPVIARQADQLLNPDARIVIDTQIRSAFLNKVASFASGMLTGDGNRFFQFFGSPRASNLTGSICKAPWVYRNIMAVDPKSSFGNKAPANFMPPPRALGTLTRPFNDGELGKRCGERKESLLAACPG